MVYCIVLYFGLRIKDPMHHCTRSLYYRLLTLHITTDKAQFNILLGSVGFLDAGSRLVRFWFSCSLNSLFLDQSVEPVFVGIHDFLNPPPWIHMIDYICTSQGGKIVVNDRSCNVVFTQLRGRPYITNIYQPHLDISII